VSTALTVPPVSSEMKQVCLKSRICQADAFSLAAVALVARVQAGTCIECWVALGSVAPRPYRATAAAEAIKGSLLTAEQSSRCQTEGAEHVEA
jgi:xanthine dehydrogenase YagS FAD-binding subunit